ncbi:MAG: hypothetical protein VX715_11245 [Planctomycetota bacterium]|nr:hypothetical protein [Planctomycetota bacterium]
MIECRPFNNSDPPAIARFWHRHPLRGLARPMTPSVLDQAVLGKLHFRADQLLLAVDGKQLLGLAHLIPPSAPSETPVPLTLNLLLVDPHSDQPQEIADTLLQAWLASYQGEACTARAFDPNLFYTGLYGGTCFPGLLESDSLVAQALTRCGFQVTHRRGIFRAMASRVSFPVDQATRQLRRTAQAKIHPVLQETDWCQANVRSHLQRTLIQLESSQDGVLLGQVETWDPSPLANDWSGPAIGIHQLHTNGSDHSEVVSRALVAEAISFIRRTPSEFIEIHDDLLPASELEGLGFELVDQGLELERRD